jgi:hypothetical protein
MLSINAGRLRRKEEIPEIPGAGDRTLQLQKNEIN